jgi:hypothetical protein
MPESKLCHFSEPHWAFEVVEKKLCHFWQQDNLFVSCAFSVLVSQGVFFLHLGCAFFTMCFHELFQSI